MKHFYRPFEQSALGFLSGSDLTQNESSLNIVEDIDLYQQPVEEPKMAILFFVIRSILSILAEICNYRVLYVLKRDNGVLSDITKLQAYTTVIIVPIRLVFITLTDFMHPLNEVFGQWICSCYWVLRKISGQIAVYHSLFVALLRFIFIAHNEKVMEYGKEKFKNWFWYMSIGIPIFTLLWISTDLIELDTDTQINRCNGADHKMFLVRSMSSFGLIKANFEKIPNFEKNDVLAKIFAVIRRVSKLAQRLWMIFLGSNIAEGFIYYKLIQHMRRSHTESMSKLKKILSDDFKILRHRRLVLNIQITILSWIFELILSFLLFANALIGFNPRNIIGNFFADEFLSFVYCVLLPSIVLVHDAELKDKVIQSDWYIGILGRFGWTYRGPMNSDIVMEENQVGDASPATDVESNDVKENETGRDLVANNDGGAKIGGDKSGKQSITSDVTDTERNVIKRAVSFRKSIVSKDCRIIDLEA